VSTSCMHIRVALLVFISGFLRAQSGVPTFRADRVLPSGGDRSVQLVPGMLVSIYGTDLGPQQGCTGQADTHGRETPSPLRPDQAFVDTLIYPKEICGVQVMFCETPAGLLYVQESQINFKVPQDVPMEGTGLLRVVYNGRSSTAVEMRLGLETASYRSSNQRVSMDRFGFTSRLRRFRHTATCKIQFEYNQRISVVIRWRFGATA
jgi:hypothetical protein